MPKYLFHGSYTPEGVRGLMAEGGTKRLEAARQALGSAGGRLEAFYFSFGEEDFYIIVDLPDNVTAAAVLSVGNASDTFRIKMTPLVTAEEVDAAMQKQIEFRPPGH
ncbi:MAG TPA: GYD domain-containing protein [Anaerolineales bacterium]|nr:GYD domain-containing protein [Anaerolineales bacterium]